jgi:glycosyltransferase involved in cell wall biosynthesis
VPPRHRVAIVQEVVLHYRESFYELLRARLAEAGTELVLVHSNGEDDVWESTVALPWAHHVPERRLRVGGREIVYQPCRQLLRGCELVIVEQGSRHLINYLLLAEQAIGLRRVALWGHGRNFNTIDASPVGERLKALGTRHAHWWFAYTDQAARIAEELGVSPNHITVVRNASDTTALREAVQQLDPDERRRTREQLGVTGGHVGLYLGSLAPAKRLDYLLDASDEVRATVPDFELLVAGAGTEEPLVRRFAETRPWVHVLGATHGQDKARALAAADVVMMPAAAGLVVLDSFAAGTPMAISSAWPHGPEADYLDHGRNGLVVEDGGDASRYGAAVAELLRSPDVREKLADGCRHGAVEYTLEGMVERFAAGIEQALATPH